MKVLTDGLVRQILLQREVPLEDEIYNVYDFYRIIHKLYEISEDYANQFLKWFDYPNYLDFLVEYGGLIENDTESRILLEHKMNIVLQPIYFGDTWPPIYI